MIPSLMIIDDNAVDQKLYSRLVKKSGLVDTLHCFLMAPDAIAFLAQPDRPAIDIILLDINMPRMNGFEFLDEAVSRFGPGFVRAAVIMLTTSISDQDRKRASAYDVVRDYIQKPLEMGHLEGIDSMLREGAF
ncbi:response regulator [Antarctobacter heliothermus]|uniref:Response regulator receiver protein n=1 Tax=Antarctobacter heliothermus TaxID=74033 RepID=A0A239GCG5_9RHOB|nr:response regulator [Antarctobacter heliothermus]SNS67026.1 response regulator receiver protein [Antarctobacter heliothermus]